MCRLVYLAWMFLVGNATFLSKLVTPLLPKIFEPSPFDRSATYSLTELGSPIPGDEQGKLTYLCKRSEAKIYSKMKRTCQKLAAVIPKQIVGYHNALFNRNRISEAYNYYADELNYWLKLFLFDSELTFQRMIKILSMYSVDDVRLQDADSKLNGTVSTTQERKFIFSRCIEQNYDNAYMENKQKYDGFFQNSRIYGVLLRVWSNGLYQFSKYINDNKLSEARLKRSPIYKLKLIWNDALFLIKKDVLKIIMRSNQENGNIDVQFYHNDAWFLFFREYYQSATTINISAALTFEQLSKKLLTSAKKKFGYKFAGYNDSTRSAGTKMLKLAVNLYSNNTFFDEKAWPRSLHSLYENVEYLLMCPLDGSYYEWIVTFEHAIWDSTMLISSINGISEGDRQYLTNLHKVLQAVSMHNCFEAQKYWTEQAKLTYRY